MTEKPFNERLPHYLIWGYGNPENKYGDILFKTNNEKDFVNVIKLGRKKGYTKFTISKHGFNTTTEFDEMCSFFQGKKTNNNLIYINEKNQISYDDWKGGK